MSLKFGGSKSKSEGSNSYSQTDSTTPYGPAEGALGSLIGGIGDLLGRASGGGPSGVPVAAQEFASGVLSGRNPLVQRATGRNPHRGYLLNRGSEAIRSAVGRGASAAGRYGSGGHASRVATGVGDFAHQFLSRAYEGDQNRTLQVLGLQNQLATNAGAIDASDIARPLAAYRGIGPLIAEIARTFGTRSTSGTGQRSQTTREKSFGAGFKLFGEQAAPVV